jgi:hypothetical protein
MQKYLLAAFLIFGFFISNAQDRQELIRRAQILAKSAGVDLNRDSRHSSRFNHMELRSPEFRGAIKQRLDRIDYVQVDTTTGATSSLGNSIFEYNSNNQITKATLNLNLGFPINTVPLLVFYFNYENNRIVNGVVEKLDFNTFQLEKFEKNTLNYNTNGLINRIVVDRYDRVLSDYKLFEMETRGFDVEGRLTQDTFFNLNIGNGIMEPNERYEITYNPHGLEQDYRGYVYENNSSTWRNLDREFYIYDANNYIQQYTYQKWEEGQMAFLNKLQKNYLFNMMGGIDRVTTSKWDSIANVWSNVEKSEFVNDNNFSREDLLLPFHYDAMFMQGEDNNSFLDYRLFNNLVKYETFFEWDNSDNNWNYLEKYTYIYSEHVVINTEDSKLEGVSFYPNPVESSLYIRNQKGAGIFELFNVQGQKIIHQEVVGDAQVDLSQQMSGFYFYKMMIGGKSATGKLLKN